MSARSFTQTSYEADTESDLTAGSEAGAVAEESGVDMEVSGAIEAAGPEVSDPADHEVMSNAGAAGTGYGEGAGGDEGAAAEAAAAEAADTETSFETDTEWSPEERFPQPTEGAGEEATLDAYFAEAADNAEDAKEFFPILAALVPVLKAAIPVVASALAQRGASALAGSVTKAAGKGAQGVSPQLAQMLMRQPLSPQFRALLQRILNRRETEGGSTEAGTEAGEIEAFIQALSTTEVVIGPDDRRQVTSTTKAPWNRICHLRIRAANGQIFLGTGFFIGRRTVATAGHCVYMASQGGWPTDIQVTQGRDGAQQPYGTVRATSFRTVKGWALRKKRECDYGAIILPQGYTQRAKSFGFAVYGDDQIRARKLNLAGYPADKPPGTMWYHGRLAKSVSPRVITYDIDSYGGQSGSAVWQRQGDKRIVVGIHTNGAYSGNSATRIVPAVYNNLITWRKEGERTEAGVSAALSEA
jgi:V8-like Glu-specific endopeptidase